MKKNSLFQETIWFPIGDKQYLLDNYCVKP